MTPAQLSQIHAMMRRRQNVVVSNLLRQHGYTYRVAFGCSLPDVKAVAEELRQGAIEGLDLTDAVVAREVAEALWADRGIRESLMLAPMLVPRGTMTVDEAQRWVADIPTREVADVVCMYAFQYGIGSELMALWRNSDAPMARYCAESLVKRLGIEGQEA